MRLQKIFPTNTQYPFLNIFVQNCPKVYNMICDYFNFFLHFSIAYIKSFQDMYHKFHQYYTYILRKCKNIGYFAVLLEKSDFYYWPMLEKRSKISLVHISMCTQTQFFMNNLSPTKMPIIKNQGLLIMILMINKLPFE